MLELPLMAEFELFEDRVGTDAQIGFSGVVTTIDRREGVATSITDSDADQTFVAEVAELESVAAGRDEKVSVAVFVDGGLTVSEVALSFVNIVKLHASSIDERGANAHGQLFVSFAKDAALSAVGFIVDAQSNGLAGDAAWTAWAVKNETLTTVSSFESDAELFG